MAVKKITRRQLLIGTGGVMLTAGAAGLWLGVDKVMDRRYRNEVDRDGDFSPNVFLSVTPDDQVHIWLTRSEMGQGVSTALPLLIAEELDADWSKVQVHQAVAGDAYDYGQLFTAGSSSVTSLWIELRRAGAVARQMLMGAAAEAWDVDVDDCVTDAGAVIHASSNRSLRYGELADLARNQRAPLRPALKSPESFRLIGQRIPRRDNGSKIHGTAKYGMDVDLPGLVHAVVARPERSGSTLVRLDSDRASQVAGFIKTVELPSGVAVVATDTWSAIKCRDALQIDWNTSGASGLSDADIEKSLTEALNSGEYTVQLETGDTGAIPPGHERIVSDEFQLPYLAHACMEPMNATAEISDDLCTLWVPTQDPNGVRRTAARLTGLGENQVRVHVTELGGGFGRRTAMDSVEEAVRIAMAVKGPVKLIWSREDDLANAEYREASAHRLEATLDADGRISSWRHHLVTGQNGPYAENQRNDIACFGATNIPYDIPNLRVLWRGVHLPVPTRIWRSVGYSYNTFVVESFVDELAASVNQDPVGFRLAHLKQGNPRLANCLSRVAELSGWPGKDGGDAGFGVAALSALGSHTALVAEVAESASGFPRVTRVWCVVDCGIAVNPDTVIAQMEGGILYGLDAALYGQVTFDGGVATRKNFDSYRVLRISEAPEIHVALVASMEAPGGIGELAVPPIAPAVSNAWVSRGHSGTKRLPFLKT